MKPQSKRKRYDMIKFNQCFKADKDSGGIWIVAFLKGRSYQMMVPDKFNGHDHNWILAVDDDGEVYAYEGTPHILNGGYSWNNGDYDFKFIGYFEDEKTRECRYHDWKNSRQCVADEVYF